MDRAEAHEIYKKSPLTADLLEWYPLKKDGDGLFIGTEGTALTHMISEKIHHLDMADAKNTFGENIYDYIFLIEDLTADTLHISEKWMADAKKSLNEDGTLFIAVHNPMGIRYLSGAPDESEKKPYAWITGRNSGEDKEYTRTELLQLMKTSGFLNVQIFYPTPDHMFPTEIWSDDFLPSAGDLPRTSYAYHEGGFASFEENLAMEHLKKRGSFANFANSFLFIAEA